MFPWMTVESEPGPLSEEETWMPSLPLPEMRLPAPEALPPIVFWGAS